MAFVRSSNIMTGWRALHLTVFALFRTGTMRFKSESWELFGRVMSGEKNS
jgi:hypothetical protein